MTLHVITLRKGSVHHLWGYDPHASQHRGVGQPDQVAPIGGRFAEMT